MTESRGGPITVEEIDGPVRRAGSVVVNIDLALVTTTDWTTYTTGDPAIFPRIQGTGGAGALATGGGSLIVGSRVIVWPRIACGRCSPCAKAHRDACSNLTILGKDVDGTLADQVLVPRNNVVNMPSTVAPADAAAAIEYADGWRLLREAGTPQPGQRVAIVGSGVTARATYHLAERMVDDVTLSALPEGVADGAPYDVIIVAASPLGSALDHLADEGTMVIHDAHSTDAPIDGAMLSKRRQRVVGVGLAGRQDLVEALRWIADHRFSTSRARPVTLDEVDDALAVVGATGEPVAVVLDR